MTERQETYEQLIIMGYSPRSRCRCLRLPQWILQKTMTNKKQRGESPAIFIER